MNNINLNLIPFVIRTTVYLACFVATMYGLSSVNYEKFIKKGKVIPAQVLYLLVALAIAKLAGDFLLSLAYRVL
ncbi:DUF1146 domain-containing protein [Anaerorhabdus sp.]|uniref:DUF1146 domain-containing protein n=1 Tax=Anaerorhabdus sp. TaxID=1872524 RepID=UPI002FC95669